VAAAEVRGIELEMHARAGRLLAVGGWSLTDSEVIDAGFEDGPGASFVRGEPLLRRPRHGANLAMTLAWARIDVTAAVSMTGSRRDRDFSTYPATPVELPRTTLVSVGGEWSVPVGRPGGTTATLLVRFDNLLDQSYEEVYGFSSPGRALRVGARFGVGGGGASE
jgi:vitamin B12 transporter